MIMNMTRIKSPSPKTHCRTQSRRLNWARPNRNPVPSPSRRLKPARHQPARPRPPRVRNRCAMDLLGLRRRRPQMTTRRGSFCAARAAKAFRSVTLPRAGSLFASGINTAINGMFSISSLVRGCLRCLVFLIYLMMYFQPFCCVHARPGYRRSFCQLGFA